MSSKSYPSTIALLGLAAVAGYANRKKLGLLDVNAPGLREQEAVSDFPAFFFAVSLHFRHLGVKAERVLELGAISGEQCRLR